ncbi:diguanylate cyclase [Undibacterium sp. Jales W-56]|uniref:sensor domain-containing diguanylate cyclase n=1 Tax=Undibacterium sp. Jales W-56 TaxID=2897325 RepID=UPI0021D07630|nr:sensor domain-containing diguanylate cyclase [Undibacterium sp. Jales W-56]MCU6432263.1 diguanylate cyclase [Undibacterium sp. Jales W-56]
MPATQTRFAVWSHVACSSAIAGIAHGAPLAETLAGIARECERGLPLVSCAIYLVDHDSGSVKVGAAPTLPADYLASVEALKIDPQLWIDIQRIDSQTVKNTPAERIRHSFHDPAVVHGIYPRLIAAIRSADSSLSGIFILYSKSPDYVQGQYQDGDQPGFIDERIHLAAIAIAHEHNDARLKIIESKLRESEASRERMALAIEGSATGIWDRDVSKNEIEYSSGWKAILGYAGTDYLSRKIEDSYLRLHPDDVDFVRATIQNHFDQKTDSYEVDHRIRCKDGSYKWISSRGKVVSRDAQGKPLRMIGTTTDISAIRAISDRLQQSVDLITSLTNEIPGLVYQYRLLASGEAFFSYVSEGVQQIYELMPDQLARDISLLNQRIHPEDFTNYRNSLEISAAHLTPWQLEYRVLLPRQGLRWCYGSAQPRRLPDGSTLWHGFISDVTERKRIEIELKEFATIDFLTQLPNRRHFVGRMEEELARVKRIASTRTAILMCDLDHFKLVNDSYGHATGDLVLKHFAAILSQQLRDNDMVGRVGGEEFAVILSDATITEASAFAKRVQQQIANTPLLVGDQVIALTVSIGIAAMSVDDASADAALSRSDMALYRAKENGRNRIEIAK